MMVLLFVFMKVVVVMLVSVSVFMMVVVLMMMLVVVDFFLLFHTFTKVQFILSNAVILHSTKIATNSQKRLLSSASKSLHCQKLAFFQGTR